jgi:ferredoxin-NADP reductase
MVEFETEIIEIIERARGVKSFRFKTAEDVKFTAGQYFFVTIRINGREKAKPFSFSNSPTEKRYVEFTKRMTGSEFSNALNGFAPGVWARLKMPLGNFTLGENAGKIAFLSGGIGITPIRSMCRYAADMRLGHDIVLLYGNNTEEDIIFKEDFDTMTKDNPRMKVVYTLTAPEACVTDEKCRKGYIDRETIMKEIPDHAERVFYVCGPPGMVNDLVGVLRNDMGIPEERVRTEQFAGY